MGWVALGGLFVQPWGVCVQHSLWVLTTVLYMVEIARTFPPATPMETGWTLISLWTVNGRTWQLLITVKALIEVESTDAAWTGLVGGRQADIHLQNSMQHWQIQKARAIYFLKVCSADGLEGLNTQEHTLEAGGLRVSDDLGVHRGNLSQKSEQKKILAALSTPTHIQ